jgi:hypothetical protein
MAVRVGKAFKGIGSAMRKGALVATAAVAGLTLIMIKAVRAANIQEDAEKKLATALGFHSQALLDQATALQKVTTFGDEAIIQAQALIGAFTKSEEVTIKATKATLDFAAGAGINLRDAANLVSKTLGSTTNALSRYGIQVEGAVGSTERLESLTKNMATIFGGQATAQAETFSGKIQQMRNAFGDLFEEIGFVLTKNQFMIKAIDLARQQFEKATFWVKENRRALMELTKTGITAVIKGIGGAIKALKFFTNGWQGLKIVGNTVAVVLADGMRIVLESLNAILFPLKKLFDGLVKIGVMDTNIIADAFDAGRNAVNQLQESTRDVLKDTLDDTRAINNAFDETSRKIDGIGASLQALEVGATVAAIATKAPPIIAAEGLAGRTPSEAAKALEALEKKSPFGATAPTAEGMTELEKLQFDQQQKLEAMRLFAGEKLTLLQETNASEAEVERSSAELKRGFEQQLQDDKVEMREAATASLIGTAAGLLAFEAQSSKKAFKLNKLFNIGQAIMNVHAGITSALRLPFPANIAAAAKTAAVGFASLKSIKSAKFGGGGGGAAGGGGGGGGGAPAPGRRPDLPIGRPEEKPEIAAQQVNVTIHTLTGHIDGAAQDALVEAINMAGKRNVKVDVNAIEGAAVLI